MIQFLRNTKMDTIKVSLIIAITIIAYYLLMQWPPATTQNLTAGDQTLSEIEKKNNDKKVEVISNYKGLADSEDTLTALEEEPLVGVDTKARIEQIKVEEPPKRKAGIKVGSVSELVQKLKNEPREK